MLKTLPALALLALVAGCGLGETAGTVATIGAGKKAELEQAQANQDRLVKELDQTNRSVDERLRAAESR